VRGLLGLAPTVVREVRAHNGPTKGQPRSRRPIRTRLENLAVDRRVGYPGRRI